MVHFVKCNHFPEDKFAAADSINWTSPELYHEKVTQLSLQPNPRGDLKFVINPHSKTEIALFCINK